MKWRCVRMCIHEGALTYPGTEVEADMQPSEHFAPVGGQIIQVDFTPVVNEPPAVVVAQNPDPDFDVKKLNKITKEQLVAFAAVQEVVVDPAGTKAEIFETIAAGIIAKNATITKDAVVEEINVFVKPNE